jgi:hypothetical protein
VSLTTDSQLLAPHTATRADWIGRDFITHQPRFHPSPGLASVSVEQIEELLSNWFERSVVMLASARTGLRLLLQESGYARHSHRVWMPQYMSRCVFSAVTHNAQPVAQPEAGSATLLYHQVGFPQRTSPTGFVIEDLAHSFFAGPATGARRWHSACAIFSLPKFFAVQGLAGGVALDDTALAQRLRERIAGQSGADPAVRSWMRTIVRASADCQPGQTCPQTKWLDAVYELLFHFCAPDASDLTGMPTSTAELTAIGVARRERAAIFRSILGRLLVDRFWPAKETLLPFALPYFSPGGKQGAHRVSATLERAGVFAGVYHFDIRRDMHNPYYLPCVLLPCHHQISVDEFTAMCEIVAEVDAAWAGR